MANNWKNIWEKRRLNDGVLESGDINKLFYSKDLFTDFAREHGMKIEFSESTVENYWNNEFVFNCFMYK